MRALDWKTILAAAVAGSGLLFAASAQAHDDDRWHDDHWRREHRHYVEEHEHNHWRHDPPRRVVYERPPVIVAPAPVMMAPAPIYAPPADPSLNLNFTIPLR